MVAVHPVVVALCEVGSSYAQRKAKTAKKRCGRCGKPCCVFHRGRDFEGNLVCDHCGLSADLCYLQNGVSVFWESQRQRDISRGKQ